MTTTLLVPLSAHLSRGHRTSQLEHALRSCTEDEDSTLREELVIVNMSVAASIAGRYRNRGVPEEDLDQVAYMGLVKAAQKYDAGAGHAFLSYCVPTIRGEVRRHFRDRGWMVRPPRRVQELQQDVLRRRSEMLLELGRPPSLTELAESTGHDEHDVHEALASHGCFTPTSLDRRTGEDGEGSSIGDLLPSPERQEHAAEARVLLGPALRCLSDRDKLIVELRFVDDLTQREIAVQLGVTQMQVSRLLQRIYTKLRDHVGDVPVDSRG